MIVEFSLRNFLSFKEEVTLSMLAAKSISAPSRETQDSGPSDTEVISPIIPVPNSDSKLLKVAAVYGANGSGKSNLIKALAFFKETVLNSFIEETILQRKKDLSYRYSVESVNEPTSFEMIFIIEGVRYRYGFEILGGAIESEWLFLKSLLSKSSRESYCFKREGQRIKVNPKTYKGAGGIRIKTRENALFLSTCALFNVGMVMRIKEWFRDKFPILTSIENEALCNTKNLCIQHPEMLKRIVEFMRLLDLDIDNIIVREREIEGVDESVRQLIKEDFEYNRKLEPESYTNTNVFGSYEIFCEHKLFENGEFKETILTPFEDESQGTRNIFALLGHWFDVMLNGGTLVIDDFGSSLHTQIAQELIKVFQSPLNQCGQLIFTTHDTNLLRGDLLRRDQVWFTQKDMSGATELYSMVEFKTNPNSSVGKAKDFGKDYLMGKYGAVPCFGDRARFVEDFEVEEW